MNQISHYQQTKLNDVCITEHKYVWVVFQKKTDLIYCFKSVDNYNNIALNRSITTIIL